MLLIYLLLSIFHCTSVQSRPTGKNTKDFAHKLQPHNNLRDDAFIQKRDPNLLDMNVVKLKQRIQKLPINVIARRTHQYRIANELNNSPKIIKQNPVPFRQRKTYRENPQQQVFLSKEIIRDILSKSMNLAIPHPNQRKGMWNRRLTTQSL